MTKYFVRRILAIIPMIFFLSIIIFIALDSTPGDPLTRLIPPESLSSTAINLDAMREAYGLNGPVYIRYFKWLANMLKGDMGFSIVSGTPVSEILANLMPSTLELTFSALIISTILGLIFGITAGIRQNSPVDYFTTVFGIIGVSFPEFFIGICAIQLFAIKLAWLPSGGRTDYGITTWFGRLPHLIMPACVLGFVLTAELMRYTRGSMVDVLSKDYVRTARAKGLPEWKVNIKHGLRNALIPIVVLICIRLPFLVGGAVVVEVVFRWPGIGSRIVEAINGKDYSIVMMVTLMIAIVVILASLLIDLVTAFLDPRIRIE